MKSIKIISLVWLVALLNCSSAENVETDLKNNAVDKELLLDLVNQLRVKGCKCGTSYYPPVGKVVWSSVLEEVSLRHSMDMAKNSYFAHKAKDGSMTQQRLERVDYNWQSYGENIYRTGGYSATEKEVVKAWRNSPSHCSNLMGKHFKEMGVAEHNNYWTQVFGSQIQ
jgi:uncharacterized protein YkwD